MKNWILSAAILTFAGPTFAADFCSQHKAQPARMDAIEAVANATQYTIEQLCSLPTLADIYVDKRTFYDENNEPVPHHWVTLHYSEYSCQYFVREADLVITRANCYNTF